MAGLGLDASIMHSTTEEAKARMGWGAYVATGAKNLLGARFATRLRIDGGEPIAHTARTVVVGNCGRLTGGITLMPDAEVDDGILDVVAITPKGIVGWAGVAVHVLAKRGQNHPKARPLPLPVDPRLARRPPDGRDRRRRHRRGPTGALRGPAQVAHRPDLGHADRRRTGPLGLTRHVSA